MRGMEAQSGDDVYKSGLADIFIPAGSTQKMIGEGIRKLWTVPGVKDAGYDQRKKLIEQFVKDRKRLELIFQDELRKYFRGVAEDITILWEATSVQTAGGNGERKQENALVLVGLSEQDRKIVDQVLMSYDMMPPPYDIHYLRVLKQTVESVNVVMGLNVMLTEPMEQEIIALGGVHKGLIDMSEQTRTAMYESLAGAREAGEGVRATANIIRGGIEAGPWNSVETRAEIIARTETRYAQNNSALRVYDAADTVESVQAFDAQLGPTDEICERRNGQIMSTMQARSEMEEEHPNGTLDFAPVIVER